MQKIKVYHFHNGRGGGVLSVLANLLEFSTDVSIENHVIYTINKKLVSNYKVNKLKGAVSEKIFYYSPDWNFHHTCKELFRLLPKDSNIVLVTHDWLELGMISHLGLQNPVVTFLHGDFDYYYQLAQKHESSIDKFICVSSIIAKRLSTAVSQREKDISYKRFPVPEVPFIKKKNSVLRCIFCVRDLTEERKQFSMLPQINHLLQQKNIVINWTIAGGGMTLDAIKKLWGHNVINNIDFKGEISNAQTLQELSKSDVFILPSLLEGLPVSLVEAMKAGAVPVITNWGGATDELVIDSQTGYYCKAKDANDFADKIKRLNSDRELLSVMSGNASKLSDQLFDPYINTNEIEQVIKIAYQGAGHHKRSVKVYGSRLDKKWVPNLITKTIRSIK